MRADTGVNESRNAGGFAASAKGKKRSEEDEGEKIGEEKGRKLGGNKGDGTVPVQMGM